MKINSKFLNFLGIILLIVVVFHLYFHYINVNNSVYAELLWYCNIASLFLFFGLIKKNSKIITSVFLTAIGAQLFWIIDFLRLIVFGESFGRTNWLLQSESLVFWISVSLHALLIPISFLGLLAYGFSKKGFILGGIIFIIILLPLTFYTTSVSDNINCIFYPCDLNIESNSIEIFSSNIYSTSEYLIYNLFHCTSSLIIIYLTCRYVLKNKKIKKIIKLTD